MREKKAGTTSYMTHIFIQDETSTTGAGKTGLDNGDISIYWIRPGDTGATAAVAINTIGTLGTFAGDAGDFAFKLIHDVNMPGFYELHISNDAMDADGPDQVTISIIDSGDNDIAPLPLQIRLTAFDLDSASTPQTGDSYAIVNSGTFGNAQLVRSTTPANKLDVNNTGEAGLDFNNIKDATSSHTLTNVIVPNVTLTATTTVSTNAQTLIGAVTSEQIVALDGGSATLGGMLNKMASDSADGSDYDAGTDSQTEIRDRGDAAWATGVTVGTGSVEWVITVDDGSDPLEGVAVWITTDEAGNNVVAGTLNTDTNGQVTFMLDAGTYYSWQQLGGTNFTNPTQITVTA